MGTRGRLRTRGGLLGAAALGVLVSALLGSGMFAVVVDSVTSTGNSVTSNGLAAPPADLRVGIIDNGEACGEATTSDDTTIAALVADESIDPTPGTQVTSHRICLYNAGGSTGNTALQFTNVFDGEANAVAGSCDNAEALPQGGNDSSCGASDPGELSEIVAGFIRYLIACPQECVHPTREFTFDEATAAPLQLFAIEPGATLVIQFSLYVDYETTEQQQQAAQSDRLQFDATFSFENQEVPAT